MSSRSTPNDLPYSKWSAHDLLAEYGRLQFEIGRISVVLQEWMDVALSQNTPPEEPHEKPERRMGRRPGGRMRDAAKLIEQMLLGRGPNVEITYQEIQGAVRDKMPSMSSNTVGRVITDMVSAGTITRVSVGKYVRAMNASEVPS